MNETKTKTNYAFFCEYRGSDIPVLREIASRAVYEHNCKVELKGDLIYITGNKPFAPGSKPFLKTVEYSNGATENLEETLQEIDRESRKICRPYFKHLALTVENSISGAKLECGDKVTLYTPNRKPEPFRYTEKEYERCIDIIGELIIQNAESDNGKAEKSGIPDKASMTGSNKDDQPQDALGAQKGGEKIMENVELTKELAAIIAIMYYRMSPKEQQDLKDNAAPEIVKVIKQALKMAAEN